MFLYEKNKRTNKFKLISKCPNISSRCRSMNYSDEYFHLVLSLALCVISLGRFEHNFPKHFFLNFHDFNEEKKIRFIYIRYPFKSMRSMFWVLCYFLYYTISQYFRFGMIMLDTFLMKWWDSFKQRCQQIGDELWMFLWLFLKIFYAFRKLF